MGEITIRKAKWSDLDQLKEMEQALIEAERPFDPTIKESNIHYYDLEGMLQNPNLLMIVAELDGRLDVYSGNTDAMSAYEKMGFRPYCVEMRMDLREEI